MADSSNNIITILIFLIALISVGHFSSLNELKTNKEKRSINIEISNSNITLMYAGEKYLNKSSDDFNVVFDTRVDKNESIGGYDTSGSVQYLQNFPATISNCFSFNVMTKNQTHIGLFSGNIVQRKHPWIEIVIGGLPNGLGNIFRRNGVDIGGTYNQQQNSLNEYEYRGFWVSWANGHYQVGIKGQKPFMSWHDANPFKINFIAVDTCCGTIGHVVVKEPNCPDINM